jgi:hypothetical protein
MEGEQPSGRPGDANASRSRRRQIALGAGAGLALAIVLWGGYSHHWPWTGINGGAATLWDWLHLLMLPLAFAVLPVWFSTETRVQHETKVFGYAVLAAFVLIVILGYTVPWGWTGVALGGLAVFIALVAGGYIGKWTWTGFTGNTLWNWLSLLLLPLLLPTVILPALKPIATARVVYLDKDGKPIEPVASHDHPQSPSEEPPEGDGIAAVPAPGSRPSGR